MSEETSLAGTFVVLRKYKIGLIYYIEFLLVLIDNMVWILLSILDFSEFHKL